LAIAEGSVIFLRLPSAQLTEAFLRDRLIDGRASRAITGVSRSKQYEKIRSGDYPTPIKDGKRTLFSERECFEYVERLKERRFNGGAI
jgi:predicted DNA-binding transcriptional regulator AlpA